VLLGHNNTLNGSRAGSGDSLAHEPVAAYAERVLVCRAPRWLGSSWYRVQRPAVLLGHNNTLNGSRAGSVGNPLRTNR
jgi:hypothetical protein